MARAVHNGLLISADDCQAGGSIHLAGQAKFHTGEVQPAAEFDADLGKSAGDMETELTNDIAIRFIHQPETLADVKPGIIILANPSRNAEGKLASGFNQIETHGNKPIDLDD